MLILWHLSVEQQVVFHLHKSIFSPARLLLHPHLHSNIPTSNSFTFLSPPSHLLNFYCLLRAKSSNSFLFPKVILEVPHYIETIIIVFPTKNRTKKQYMTRARTKGESKEMCAMEFLWKKIPRIYSWFVLIKSHNSGIVFLRALGVFKLFS